jgi:polar amino acid transport system substrate-binding protein
MDCFMLRQMFFIIVLLLGLFMAETSGHGPTVIVVGSHSPPFRIFEQDKASGIYFDTIREIGRRMCFTPKFVKVPFKRALDMMYHGGADVMPGPNYSEERAERMLYTGTMLPAEPKAFYYLKPGNKIVQFSDLYGKRVVSTLGKDYNSVLEESPEIRLEVVSTYEVAIRMLLSGRVDACILPEFQGDYILHTCNLKFFKSSFRLAGKPSHICLSHNSVLRGRQEELKKTMRAIVEDGTFQEILDRYSLNRASP